MTVRIGRMTFSDWVSLPFQGGWSDTFIFRIDSQACIPPFDYAPLLKRIVAPTRKIRSSASIWVQVEAPGEWYMAEVNRSLRGLSLPYAVTHASKELEYLDFSFRPTLLHAPSPPPLKIEAISQAVSPEELRCLQALGRMKKGNEEEIAALANLPIEVTSTQLRILAQRKLAVYKTSPRIKRGKSSVSQIDLFPSWHPSPEGLPIALRSWGVPKGVEFTSRLEEHLQQIGSEHRHIARIGPAWLKSAWPQAEIWTGWSEVRIPGLSVIPDALAWGRVHGYETLFWLEVGDEHKSINTITTITKKRLDGARELCRRTGVRIVYIHLSTPWVHKATQRVYIELPKDMAVVLGGRKEFGKLPIIEWGNVNQ